MGDRDRGQRNVSQSHAIELGKVADLEVIATFENLLSHISKLEPAE